MVKLAEKRLENFMVGDLKIVMVVKLRKRMEDERRRDLVNSHS